MKTITNDFRTDLAYDPKRYNEEENAPSYAMHRYTELQYLYGDSQGSARLCPICSSFTAHAYVCCVMSTALGHGCSVLSGICADLNWRTVNSSPGSSTSDSYKPGTCYYICENAQACCVCVNLDSLQAHVGTFLWSGITEQILSL
jgi:hypothetical protein